MPKPVKHVFVCSQSRPEGHPRGSCAGKGSSEVLQTFWRELQQHNAYDRVAVTYSGCLGPCDGGVNVLVYPEGVLYQQVTAKDVKEIFDSHLMGDQIVSRLCAPADAW